jgi:hypothetical protein
MAKHPVHSNRWAINQMVEVREQRPKSRSNAGRPVRSARAAERFAERTRDILRPAHHVPRGPAAAARHAAEPSRSARGVMVPSTPLRRASLRRASTSSSGCGALEPPGSAAALFRPPEHIEWGVEPSSPPAPPPRPSVRPSSTRANGRRPHADHELNANDPVGAAARSDSSSARLPRPVTVDFALNGSTPPLDAPPFEAEGRHGSDEDGNGLHTAKTALIEDLVQALHAEESHGRWTDRLAPARVRRHRSGGSGQRGAHR